MKYFVVSDVHGFYSILKKTLDEKGFDENNPNHKLIICGDIMDRGSESLQMQSYIMHLINLDKVILIRGNHEDLMLDFLNNFCEYKDSLLYAHHYSNGTVETAFKLSKRDWLKNYEYLDNPEDFIRDVRNSAFVKYIIPKTVDYFETEHYVFTHGFIPYKETTRKLLNGLYAEVVEYDENWRNASKEQWQSARWENGQQLAVEYCVNVPNKTIVCGHFICSYGHSEYEKQGTCYGDNDIVSPFYAKGLIAIDACTAYSGKMNCLIIED